MQEVIEAFKTGPVASIITVLIIVSAIYGAAAAIANIDKYFFNKREKKFDEKIKSIEDRAESISAFEMPRNYRHESDLMHISAVIYAGNDEIGSIKAVQEADLLIQSVISFLAEKDKESEKKLQEMFGEISREDRIKNVTIT